MWHLKLVIIYFFVIESASDCPNVRTELRGIRQRRHLTFPDGADFVMTISLVKAFMTHAPAGWNLALEIDVLFPLPDANFTNAQFRRKLHHRQKREFWERLQNALEYHNLNGQACILRSICEARSHLAAPGKSLVHDLLRVIFTDPDKLVLPVTCKTKLCSKNSYAMAVKLYNKLPMDIRRLDLKPFTSALYKWLVDKCFYSTQELLMAPVHEQEFMEEVGGRYEDLRDPHLCDKVNDCPISLLKIVLALNKQK